jgi:hypothetical protein
VIIASTIGSPVGGGNVDTGAAVLASGEALESDSGSPHPAAAEPTAAVTTATASQPLVVNDLPTARSPRVDVPKFSR